MSTKADESDTGVAQFGQADVQFEYVDNHETLDEAMTRLPVREAEIIRLRFFEELTQREIAERMAISQVHVSRLLARSLALLRSLFVEKPSSPVVSAAAQ